MQMGGVMGQRRSIEGVVSGTSGQVATSGLWQIQVNAFWTRLPATSSNLRKYFSSLRDELPFGAFNCRDRLEKLKSAVFLFWLQRPASTPPASSIPPSNAHLFFIVARWSLSAMNRQYLLLLCS